MILPSTLAKLALALSTLETAFSTLAAPLAAFSFFLKYSLGESVLAIENLLTTLPTLSLAFSTFFSAQLYFRLNAPFTINAMITLLS